MTAPASGCAGAQEPRLELRFMIDHTADGRSFKILNIIDEYTRECWPYGFPA